MTILVTGGSGFLGQHLIPKLLKKYPAAIIKTLSRDGNAIQKLIVKCPDKRLIPIVGDIKDKSTVEYATQGVNIAIHLAALKHIDLCELYPIEAIETNINGTRNLLDAFSGNTFISMSTDKASEATSCYGATKLIIEKMVLEQAKKQKDRRYIIVRSGNLFGSTGSVIDRWKQQIKQHNMISITNLSMTRFFISASSVAEHIISLIENGLTECISIPNQKALKLSDLAKTTIELWGNKNTDINIIGARAGEKEHESLYSVGEKIVPNTAYRLSSEAPMWTLDEIKQELEDIVK